MKEDKKKIGEILLGAGIINTMQLSVALGEQKQWGGRLGSVITRLGFADEKDIARVLEGQLGQSCISLEERIIPPDVLRKVRVDVAKKYGVIPIDFNKGVLTVAMSDPTDLGTLDELDFTLGVRVKPVLALESGIRRAIALHYEGVVPETKTYKSVLGKVTEESGIVKDERDRTATASTEKAPAEEFHYERKESPGKAAFEALLSLLLEKGFITREELMKKIEEQSGPD